jgi:hypothetical protein
MNRSMSLFDVRCGVGSGERCRLAELGPDRFEPGS